MSSLSPRRAVRKAAPTGAPRRLEDLLDPGVHTVDVMLTTGCNLRCAYCLQKRGGLREMAPEVLDAAIRRLLSSRLDRPRLKLFGGEPLLAAPLVRRALKRVRKWAPRGMKPDIHIVTNGTRLDEKTTGLLASRDVFIALSFDGVAPAQDDRSPGSFELLDRLLVRLKRDHPRHFRTRVAVLATLTSRNVPYLATSFSYFLSRGIRDVRVVPALPDDPSWSGRQAHELDEQLTRVVRLSVAEFRRSGKVPFGPFRGAAAESTTDWNAPCACGSRGLLFVDVDGTLAPCAAFAPSVLGAQPRAILRIAKALGGLHVTDSDLPSALAGREERTRSFPLLAKPEDRHGPNGPCARCRSRPVCFVCPIAVASGGGRVPAFHCDVNRLFARHRTVFLSMKNRLDVASARKSAGV